MQIYIQKDLIYKMITESKKGFLKGEKFFDVFYIYDVIFTSINKIKYNDLIFPFIIGEYIYQEKIFNDVPLLKFKNNDIQWIKLFLSKNNLNNKDKEYDIYGNLIFIKAFLNTINFEEKKNIVEQINVIII